jgi:hypothetical protein
MGVRNQKGNPPGISGNILVAQHRCRNKQGSPQGFWPTFAPPSCNLRTGFKRVSETNKETAVSGKQSGYLPHQEADLEGPEKNEGTTFLATFGQPTFFILIFYSTFLIWLSLYILSFNNKRRLSFIIFEFSKPETLVVKRIKLYIKCRKIPVSKFLFLISLK